MPGVNSPRVGILRHLVDSSDWLKMLTMHDPRTVFQVGNWVRVGKGKYKGDVGFVSRVENLVEVLLVPRLNPPTTIDTSKRKRTAVRSKPELFDPDTIKAVYGIDPKCGPEGIYTAFGLKFESGLLLKLYNFHSISPTAEIPSYTAIIPSSSHRNSTNLKSGYLKKMILLSSARLVNTPP